MTLSSENVHIPVHGVSTLAWDGDELMDVTSNQRFQMDGSFSPIGFAMGYRFDRGQCRRAKGLLWTLAYDNRHTKAVLLKNGKVIGS